MMPFITFALFYFYKTNPPTVVSFMPAIASTSGRLHSEFIRLLFLQAHRETDRFFEGSGVQLTPHNSGLFQFHRVVYSTQVKMWKSTCKTEPLRIYLNLDGEPIASRSHTHPFFSLSSHRYSYITLLFGSRVIDSY